MKFIIDKDQIVSIDNKLNPNSGSIKYYKIEVECDDSWNELTIEAVMLAKEKKEEPVSIAVINGEMYIDKKMSGLYAIGFIGYRVENEEKTYQVSTNLSVINFDVGAGEFETINSESIPEITEWEKYLAQVQEFINNGNQIIQEANNLDVDADGEILTITKKDGTQKEVNIKGEKGDCNFATFEVNNNMELVMNKTEDMLLEFNLNENGELEVII